MSIRKWLSTITVASGLCFSQMGHAKISADEAARLGTELTPMGATIAGNAAGTIPAYTGKILGAPDWVQHSKKNSHYPDMYPDEKPLFVITAANWQEHQANLSDGQIALFKKYPDTFQMKIYPSHRDVRYNDTVLKATHLNATKAEVNDEYQLSGAHGGIPFPIPQKPLEVLYNHMASPSLWNFEATLNDASVFSDGQITLGSSESVFYLPYYDPKLSAEKIKKLDGIAAYVFLKVLLPVREKGQMVLVHEYMDKPRDAWAYVPGARRVRRAPTVGYDTPAGIGNLITVDDYRLFNGSADRYNWTSEADRELYIPYHNYAVDSPELSYTDLLTQGHFNPEPMRYELHRVKIVTGTLKDGNRHLYGKRRLYLDEDTWSAVLADNYDNKGNLWKANMRTMINAYDMPGMTGRLEIFHDLTEGAYYVANLLNEQKSAITIPKKPYSKKFFTPSKLRAKGTR